LDQRPGSQRASSPPSSRSIAGAADHHEIGLFALVLAVAAVSAITTVLGALATGAQCWLLYASFIVGRSGSLVVDESSADAAGLFAVVALAATGIGNGRTFRARITR